MSLCRGRMFTIDELAENRPVAILNEKLASRHLLARIQSGKGLKWGAPQNNNTWLKITQSVASSRGFRMQVATEYRSLRLSKPRPGRLTGWN